MTQLTNFLKNVCFISTIFLLNNCQGQVAITNISTPPSQVAEDRKYANIYQLLDGKWKGSFLIYEDIERTKKDEKRRYNLSIESIKHPHLKLVNTIEVKQTYTSESPYFQRVIIEDYYPEKNQRVISNGVNKIQDGKMWCVVKKPDELIVHIGKAEGEKTIIWERSESNPQRVEYFRETVEENTYEIIGWGYYEGDDLELMPKYWFYGKYTRE